jgi:hypothetical protein
VKYTAKTLLFRLVDDDIVNRLEIRSVETKLLYWLCLELSLHLAINYKILIKFC